MSIPGQINWGRKDLTLTLREYRLPMQTATGIDRFVALLAKHFSQEEQSPTIAAKFAEMNSE